MVRTQVLRYNGMLLCFGAAMVLLMGQCQSIPPPVMSGAAQPITTLPDLEVEWMATMAEIRAEARAAAEAAAQEAEAARSRSGYPVLPFGGQASRLVIDLGDRQVYMYRGQTLVNRYPIATGQDGWETPVGNFRVTQLQTDPVWRHPITKAMVFPGPENPLGSRWIGFWNDGEYQIGIHGTNQPELIGMAVSHGCLRMHNRDIEALYSQLRLGTPIIVQR